MPRLFSTAVILAIAFVCLPTRAQEPKSACKRDCSTCQDCPAKQAHGSRSVEINLPGIDFPFGVLVAVENEVKAQQESDKKGAITVSCECKLLNGVPVFSNVPYLSRFFTHTAPSDDCPTDGVPVLSSLPNISQAYVNGIAVDAAAAKCCAKKSQCKKGGCGCPAMAMKKKSAKASCCSTQGNSADVRMVGFVKSVAENNEGANQPEMMEEMLELRIENERLQMRVEAVEFQMEMMHEMADMREENAVLRTRLEFFEKHHGHAGAKKR